MGYGEKVKKWFFDEEGDEPVFYFVFLCFYD